MAKSGVTFETRGDTLTPMTERLDRVPPEIRFGWFADAVPYPDGTDVKQVAAAHEFGTPTIPARAPVRSWVDGGGFKEVGDKLRKVLGDVIDGDDPGSITSLIGKLGVEGIKDKIERGLSPPLAASTRANPGRDPAGLPLLDTRHLVNQLSWKEGSG